MASRMHINPSQSFFHTSYDFVSILQLLHDTISFYLNMLLLFLILTGIIYFFLLFLILFKFVVMICTCLVYNLNILFGCAVLFWGVSSGWCGTIHFMIITGVSRRLILVGAALFYTSGRKPQVIFLIRLIVLRYLRLWFIAVINRIFCLVLCGDIILLGQGFLELFSKSIVNNYHFLSFFTFGRHVCISSIFKSILYFYVNIIEFLSYIIIFYSHK